MPLTLRTFWGAALALLTSSAGFAHEGKPAPAVEQRTLDVKLADKSVAKWTTKDIAAWPALTVTAAGVGGKTKQYALADRLPAGTRLVAVVVATGQRVAIDEKWASAGQAVLWQNRRGLFKLGFADANGVAVPNIPELRDVIVLELASIAPVAAPAR